MCGIYLAEIINCIKASKYFFSQKFQTASKPRLGKRELICLLSFTCNYVVFVWRGFLFLWVLGMGYVILLWHSLSLPYNYFETLVNLGMVNFDLPVNQTMITQFQNAMDLIWSMQTHNRIYGVSPSVFRFIYICVKN